MSETKRTEFLVWYEEKKPKRFDNKCVLESYCWVNVTVLWQACQIFRREFMAIGNIDVFLESITVACSCN
jgi:hypothetical protein